MDPLRLMEELGHEQLVFCRNERSGLRALIAIHDTTLGPALGGCRFYPYSSEEEAVVDVLRLSRGMTYKAAVSGLDLGGGKAVIIGDPSIKSEALFRAFGRHVQALGGRYITAEDMNTSEADMEMIGRETSHVTGKSVHQGGSGDPSPVTALGVYHGIRACLEVVHGSPDPRGRRVAIQGLGSVGSYLAGYLHEAGAELLYTDIAPARVRAVIERCGGSALDGDAWYEADVDVLAPCAIGAIINPETIPRVRAPIIAGGANNVLAEEVRDGEALVERGITYATDYVINAGGIISIQAELHGWPQDRVVAATEGIGVTVGKVLARAADASLTPTAAANAIAEERIASAADLRRFRL